MLLHYLERRISWVYYAGIFPKFSQGNPTSVYSAITKHSWAASQLLQLRTILGTKPWYIPGHSISRNATNHWIVRKSKRDVYKTSRCQTSELYNIFYFKTNSKVLIGLKTIDFRIIKFLFFDFNPLAYNFF